MKYSSNLCFSVCHQNAQGKWAPQKAFYEITLATTLAQMLYTSLSWWGFTSAAERACLERLMGRMRHGGYLQPDDPAADPFAHEADDVLMIE